MRIETIVDAADPRLADFHDLSDADVRPDRRGVVIAEGANVVARLAQSRYPMRAVIGVPARLAALQQALAEHDVPGFRDVPGYAVDKWLLSEVVGFRVTRGVLASADRLPARAPAELISGARRLAIAEGLNDFENLGALFRNAAAFGVDAVLLEETCADPLYRRSVRVSMGHVLRVPFTTLPGPWPGSLDQLRAAGIRLLALTPQRPSRPLPELPAPPRWAIMLGAEGPGLSAAALAAADERVRIPMAEGVDSLNVATAAAVAFALLG